MYEKNRTTDSLREVQPSDAALGTRGLAGRGNPPMVLHVAVCPSDQASACWHSLHVLERIMPGFLPVESAAADRYMYPDYHRKSMP